MNFQGKISSYIQEKLAAAALNEIHVANNVAYDKTIVAGSA